MTDDKNPLATVSQILDRADLHLTRVVNPDLGVVTRLKATRRTDNRVLSTSVATSPIDIEHSRVDVLALELGRTLLEIHDALGN